MGISKNEVVSHAQAVWEREVQVFTERKDEILARAQGGWGSNSSLRHVARYIRRRRSLLTDQVQFSFRLPEPSVSAGLFRSAWDDLCEEAPVASAARNRDRQQRLAKIINDFILPMSELRASADEIVKAAVSPNSGVGACIDAESYFLDARRQAMTGHYRGQHKLSVYHDSQGLPLIFRKHYESNSGISLVPLALEGTIVPAGTIMGLDESMRDPHKMTGRKDRTHGYVATYLADTPVPIRPIRISPWAYEDPLDRARFTVMGDFGYPVCRETEYVKPLQTYDLDSFRTAAQRIMDICSTAQSANGEV